jgi:hypothetical protein
MVSSPFPGEGLTSYSLFPRLLKSHDMTPLETVSRIPAKISYSTIITGDKWRSKEVPNCPVLR